MRVGSASLAKISAPTEVQGKGWHPHLESSVKKETENKLKYNKLQKGCLARNLNMSIFLTLLLTPPSKDVCFPERKGAFRPPNLQHIFEIIKKLKEHFFFQKLDGVGPQMSM